VDRKAETWNETEGKPITASSSGPHEIEILLPSQYSLYELRRLIGCFTYGAMIQQHQDSPSDNQIAHCETAVATHDWMVMRPHGATRWYLALAQGGTRYDSGHA
jgi:hypothetical protein